MRDFLEKGLTSTWIEYKVDHQVPVPATNTRVYFISNNLSSNKMFTTTEAPVSQHCGESQCNCGATPLDDIIRSIPWEKLTSSIRVVETTQRFQRGIRRGNIRNNPGTERLSASEVRASRNTTAKVDETREGSFVHDKSAGCREIRKEFKLNHISEELSGT
ncbi:hypothetical protein BV22DRAFT_1118957 [Leucogyrophana mollusca]|uniref:Uncharacterized protein n=1 Tax=Leucogyrophana mollusca TaxID=85980 RepID=A0ACB8BK65_9AGAM|nr:hypothetical protein BV22DRAFT_1118957 [Leucogyrophana mollusca]